MRVVFLPLVGAALWVSTGAVECSLCRTRVALQLPVLAVSPLALPLPVASWDAFAPKCGVPVAEAVLVLRAAVAGRAMRPRLVPAGAVAVQDTTWISAGAWSQLTETACGVAVARPHTPAQVGAAVVVVVRVEVLRVTIGPGV